ncbi:MAG: TonB-dependent receptor [Bacteroidetes bacterium]|nr:MAG: TonB-dependent receptor [Bacteroidota bacterium]
MNKLMLACCVVLTAGVLALPAQTFRIYGKVMAEGSGEALDSVQIFIPNTPFQTQSNAKGLFQLKGVPTGTYEIVAFYLGFQVKTQPFTLEQQDVQLEIHLPLKLYELEEVRITEEKGSFGMARLNAVEGTAIYAAKKNEVVLMDQLTANLAANTSRQIYARVAGLNIWESDGAGVQLGIGGRGLSPNRNANFNTRQNGYDISADALGYPESYYTPPAEALDRIEIVRGAASLQYGTQFGGMLNFHFKTGPQDKKLAITTRQSVGSFGLFTSFNSLGGTVGKLNYYTFYQYKRSRGWRPNSGLEQHTAYSALRYQLSPRISIRGEYTHTQYLAQQPGGLTDAQFAENPRQSQRERNWFRVDWNLFALTTDVQLSAATKLNNRSFALLAGRDALGNLERINLMDFGGPRDLLMDRYRNWGNELRFMHRYNTLGNPSVLLLGSRYYQGFTHRQQGLGSDGKGPDFFYLHPERLEGSDFELPSRNLSFFAENVFHLSPRFSLTPGLRMEYIQTQARGYYTQRVEDLAGNVLVDEQIEEEKSHTRSFLFGGLGLSYKPGKQWEYYANISQNYRAINFNDIRVNVGSLVVDPNLRDERGFNADLGLRGEISGLLNVDVSLFYLSYRDRIGTVLKKEPNPRFNNLVDRLIRYRTNVADARIAGLESYVEFNPLKLLLPAQSELSASVFVNLALIHARYLRAESAAVEGNAVELVPPFNLKTGLNLSWKELKASFQYAYVARHYTDATNALRTPTAVEGIIPAYQVMDLSLQYRLGRVQLETGVNNLANALYFTRRASGYPGPGIIPSDGRSYYFSVQLEF